MATMIYTVINKVSGLPVYEYQADAPIEWNGMEFSEFDHVPSVVTEITPEPVTVYGGRRMLSKLEFISLLGDAAYIAILTIAHQSVEIEAWIKMIELTSVEPDTGWAINLDDPRTAAGVQSIGSVLAGMGVVGSDWAAGVLNG